MTSLCLSTHKYYNSRAIYQLLVRINIPYIQYNIQEKHIIILNYNVC